MSTSRSDVASSSSTTDVKLDASSPNTQPEVLSADCRAFAVNFTANWSNNQKEINSSGHPVRFLVGFGPSGTPTSKCPLVIGLNFYSAEDRFLMKEGTNIPVMQPAVVWHNQSMYGQYHHVVINRSGQFPFPPSLQPHIISVTQVRSSAGEGRRTFAYTPKENNKVSRTEDSYLKIVKGDDYRITVTFLDGTILRQKFAEGWKISAILQRYNRKRGSEQLVEIPHMLACTLTTQVTPDTDPPPFVTSPSNAIISTSDTSSGTPSIALVKQNRGIKRPASALAPVTLPSQEKEVTGDGRGGASSADIYYAAMASASTTVGGSGSLSGAAVVTSTTTSSSNPLASFADIAILPSDEQSALSNLSDFAGHMGPVPKKQKTDYTLSDLDNTLSSLDKIDLPEIKTTPYILDSYKIETFFDEPVQSKASLILYGSQPQMVSDEDKAFFATIRMVEQKALSDSKNCFGKVLKASSKLLGLKDMEEFMKNPDAFEAKIKQDNAAKTTHSPTSEFAFLNDGIHEPLQEAKPQGEIDLLAKESNDIINHALSRISWILGLERKTPSTENKTVDRVITTLEKDTKWQEKATAFLSKIERTIAPLSANVPALRRFEKAITSAGIKFPHGVHVRNSIERAGFKINPSPLNRDLVICETCGVSASGLRRWWHQASLTSLHDRSKHTAAAPTTAAAARP